MYFIIITTTTTTKQYLKTETKDIDRLNENEEKKLFKWKVNTHTGMLHT